MTIRTIKAPAARRFLVERHLLAPPRALPARPDSVLRVIERLGSVQFDPLCVPGARNHDLVLHARIERYERAHLDGYLYGPPGSRRLFEAYNKSLNILPTSELPYFRLAWRMARERHDTGILRTRKKQVKELLARLATEGPLSSLPLSRASGRSVDWHWGPTSETRALFEALFETGRVGIARRDGNRRYYAPIEQLLPAPLLLREPPREEAARHRLLSRYRAVGLLGEGGSPETFHRTGPSVERKRLLAGLIDDGTLTPVSVEGVRGVRHVLTGELPILDAVRPGDDAPAHVAFLAPLDPLLWDRGLVEQLFGFTYRWEVYTPEARREHGYYVLPVLFGDRLVGRIEPRFDREARKLVVAGVWFEANFEAEAEPAFLPAFEAALGDFARFVGAARVAYPRVRLFRTCPRVVA